MNKHSLRVSHEGILYQVIDGKLMASGCSVNDESACFMAVTETDFDSPDELDEFMETMKGLVKMEFAIAHEPVILDDLDEDTKATYAEKHTKWYMKGRA